MMNQAVFGPPKGREALAEATLALEIDTDWCVGGCEPWQQSEAGRARYAELKRRWEELNADVHAT